MQDKKVVTRFAPSPTGHFHLGGVRSALYNYLFAKQNKGAYILRSEDTDKERSKKEYEDGFLELFKWLELKPDHFFRQSERTEICMRLYFAWQKDNCTTPNELHLNENDL